MQVETQALGIAASLVDAVLDSSALERAIVQLKAACGAEAATILIESTGGEFAFAYEVGFGEVGRNSYMSHFGRLDEAMMRLRRQPKPLAINLEFLDERQFVRSEFYCDFFRPFNIHYALGSLLQIRERELVFIGVNKSRRSGGFHKKDIALVQAVLPIFKRSIELSRHLGKMDADRRLKNGLVDQVPFGILLIGPDREIRYMNDAAQRMARAEDGLSSKGNKLRLADAQADAAFAKLLRKAAPSLAAQVPAGGLMDAPRPSGLRSYCISVLPAAEEGSAAGGNSGSVTVLVSEPDAAHRLAPETLVQLFGLTPAEARLAVELAEGHALAEICERFGISRATATTQLGAVFRKMEVARQSELVAVINRGVGRFF